MRSKAAALALALAIGTSLTTAAFFVPTEASAQSRRGYDMFYDDLAQDGRWVDHPRYGWVWYPTRVREDWRPYNDGRWVWTDQYGWYWESNERFGWATYHYGRWGYDDQYGHIWVPGDEWAPAWVSFRDSDEAIGWAPLPPETLGMALIALLSGGRGSSNYRYVDMSDSYYQPRWTFVPTRYFTDDRVYTHAYSWRDNDRYYRGSNNVTNYVTVNNYYVNRSIDPRRWESRTGRKLDRIEVREVNDRREWSNDRRGDNQLRVYNPRIERDRDGRSAPPQQVRATAADKPVVRVQREWTAPEERRDRANTRDEWRQRYTQAPERDRNDRDGNARDGNAQGQTDRDRNTPGQNERDRAQDRNRDGKPDTVLTPQQRAEQERAQQQKMQQDRAQQQKATQDKAQQDRAQQQKAAQEKAAQDRLQQKSAQEKAAQDRAQQQRAAQEKAQQDRAQQQKMQQERAQQQREQQQKAQQDRAQQQKAAQEKAQEQRAQQQKQQQERVQQQRDNDQRRAAPTRTQAPDRAAPPQRPQQAERPQQEQKQQPQKQQQQQRGGNECPPGQTCR